MTFPQHISLALLTPLQTTKMNHIKFKPLGTQLHDAASGGHVKAMEFLFDNGIGIEAIDKVNVYVCLYVVCCSLSVL
jgi:hypothetical protein